MAARTGGQIEVRGDVESRPAFERQPLDVIGGSLNHAHDAWIEGCPLQRPAEHLPHLRCYDFLPLVDSLRRRNRVNHLSPPLTRLARDANEVPLEIVRVVRQRGILDAEFHAGSAVEAIWCCGLSGATAPGRRDDGSGSLEEVATRERDAVRDRDRTPPGLRC